MLSLHRFFGHSAQTKDVAAPPGGMAKIRYGTALFSADASRAYRPEGRLTPARVLRSAQVFLAGVDGESPFGPEVQRPLEDVFNAGANRKSWSGRWALSRPCPRLSSL